MLAKTSNPLHPHLTPDSKKLNNQPLTQNHLNVFGIASVFVGDIKHSNDSVHLYLKGYYLVLKLDSHFGFEPLL